MIHISHLVPAPAGTGSVAAAKTSKPALQKAHGDNKMTDPRHRSRQISRSILIGVVNFEGQALGQPSFEPLSP